MEKQVKITPTLAESFEVDFLNAQRIQITEVMAKMGFQFRRSGVQDEGIVYYQGERSDGTTINITIEKGDNYQSPAEIGAEEKA